MMWLVHVSTGHHSAKAAFSLRLWDKWLSGNHAVVVSANLGAIWMLWVPPRQVWGGDRDSQDEAGLMKGYKFSRAWCLVEIGASGRGHISKGLRMVRDGRKS